MVQDGLQEDRRRLLLLPLSPENDWYPHYIHNLDNLIRFGGLYPADPRQRRHPPDAAVGRDVGLRGRLHGGACQGPDLPDAGPERQEDRPLEEPEHDQERLVAHQEHMGIESMLRLNDMTMDDVEIVEFPYPDDWYDDPEMLAPMNNPSDLWLTP